MKRIITLMAAILFCQNLIAQPFTLADTLRGSNGPGRYWWDVVKYDLHINFHPEDSSINGYNVISFQQNGNGMGNFFQIDLQEPLVIDSVILDMGIRVRKRKIGDQWRYSYTSRRASMPVEKHGNAWFVRLDKAEEAKILPPVIELKDTADFIPNLTVYYHGRPHVARMPPWDGGIVWKKDAFKRPFIGVACQGLGASIWYPCKDYQGDEPDSGATMHFRGPDTLKIISNGRRIDSIHHNDGTHTQVWEVTSPINSYCISPYLAKYVHFDTVYQGEKGPLTVDYYVIDSNLQKAKKQFKDVTRMLEAFEYWFGPYPFYADGYKLVEAPYLGMEHQSAVAYGNHYKNGYMGRDLSGTGWGLKWDFIIVHESGHEWFGNNITTADIADMWVHEGFTNYSETLFTEYFYGKDAGTDYVVGIRKNIMNDRPIVGPYGVNEEGSGDMYYKAANMIHYIRQVINDDDKFRSILGGLNKDFFHSIVTGKQIEEYISKKSGIDFSKLFDQYLRTTLVPVLEYKIEKGRLLYRWSNVVEGFDMPVRIADAEGKYIWIHPGMEYKTAPEGIAEIKVDRNFYVKVKEGE